MINRAGENISKEYRFKNIEEINNHSIKEIYKNELMSNKDKKVCTTLNYSEHSLILTTAVTGSVSTYDFASLLAIPIAITSSVIGLKTFTNNCRN